MDAPLLLDTSPAGLDALTAEMVATLRAEGWPITEAGAREIRRQLEVLRGVTDPDPVAERTH